MAYDFIPIVDGDSLTAEDLKSRFTSIETEINNLDQVSVLPRSLDNQHIASQVLFSKQKSIPDPTVTHAYANIDPGSSLAMTTSTSIGASGWHVIREGGQYGASAGSGDELSLYFGSAGSFTVGDTTAGVGGILVMANIQVTKLQYITVANNLVVESPNLYGKFAIQVRNGSTGTWNHLLWTERFLEGDTVDQMSAASNNGQLPVFQDIALRTLIPDSAYLGAIDAVRVVCCTRNGVGGILPIWMTLLHCNISVMVFHGHMRPY